MRESIKWLGRLIHCLGCWLDKFNIFLLCSLNVNQNSTSQKQNLWTTLEGSRQIQLCGFGGVPPLPWRLIFCRETNRALGGFPFIFADRQKRWPRKNLLNGLNMVLLYQEKTKGGSERADNGPKRVEKLFSGKIVICPKNVWIRFLTPSLPHPYADQIRSSSIWRLP